VAEPGFISKSNGTGGLRQRFCSLRALSKLQSMLKVRLRTKRQKANRFGTRYWTSTPGTRKRRPKYVMIALQGAAKLVRHLENHRSALCTAPL